MENNLYNSILFALIIGIVLSLGVNIWMRGEIKKEEGFSELYFEEHRQLPEVIELNNESYEISEEEKEAYEVSTLLQQVIIKYKDRKTIEKHRKLIEKQYEIANKIFNIYSLKKKRNYQ